jgi:hypothetical protein
MPEPRNDLYSLLILTSLPVLACCAIVWFDEGVKHALLFDFFKMFVIFFVVAGALCWVASYWERRSEG